jgi:tripartite motif-containing protein 71
VYVADQGNHRIQKFTSEGAFLAEWGGFGTEDGLLSGPLGIAVQSTCTPAPCTPTDNVFVTDTVNSRIQKFTNAGGLITVWGGPGSADGEFSSPRAIVVKADGTVYVADTFNNRIQRFTLP